MRVLLTGFEPYWDYTLNSSWVVAQQIASATVSNAEIVAELLPVSFARVAGALAAAVERHNPELIIMLGQSGGSDRIKLERAALNLMDARLADNDGYIPDEQPIDPSGPAALFTHLPIKALREAVEAKGIAVKISNSCGLYVCNRVYYQALTICSTRPNMGALFIHLPYYSGQATAKVGKPTMPVETMVEAVQTIIKRLND